MIAQCPVLKINISDHLNSLNEIKDIANQKAVEQDLNKKQTKFALRIIKDNMTHIEDTIILADESMKVTDDQYKKIRNAMVW